MTQLPRQEPKPGVDLDRWLVGDGGLDFRGVRSDPTGIGVPGLPFGGAPWDAPGGGFPFGQPRPSRNVGQEPPDGFVGGGEFEGRLGGALSGGFPTGVGQMPLIDPNKTGGTAADDSDGEEFGRQMQDVLADAGHASDMHVHESGDCVMRVFAQGSNEDVAVYVFVSADASLVVIIPAQCGGGAEGNDGKPANAHEAFDSVFWAYANLWAAPATNDQPGLVTNPRSMENGAALAGADRGALLRSQRAGSGGGLEVGLGPVDILPAVGNKDPNPNAADKPSLTDGFKLPQLDVIDPVPDPGP